MERSGTECGQFCRQSCDKLMELIEQARDEILQQIQSTKEQRKQQLQHDLNKLTKINKNIVSTQQRCGQIARNTEMTPMIRLQNIKQIISNFNEEEKENKENIFNNELIDKSNYKLIINFDIDRFVNILQSTMKLQFLDESFQLNYNNDPSPPKQQLQQATMINQQQQQQIQSNNNLDLNLMASTTSLATVNTDNTSSSTHLSLYDDNGHNNDMNNNGSLHLHDMNGNIDLIQLEFNAHDFMMNNNNNIINNNTASSPKPNSRPPTPRARTNNKQKQQHLLSPSIDQQQQTHKKSKKKHKKRQKQRQKGKTLSNLQLQHNVNRLYSEQQNINLTAPISSSSQIQEINVNKNHRRAQSATGLIQSNYQNHHSSPMKVPQPHPSKQKRSIPLTPHTANNSSFDDLDETIRSPLYTHNTNSFGSRSPSSFIGGTPSLRSMKRRNTVHNGLLSDRDRDELLVDGYIRKYSKYSDIVIPNQIFTISYDYYHFDCELLKFSKIYKSGDGWRFFDGNTSIKRRKVATALDLEHDNYTDHDDDDDNRYREIYQNYKWILLDIQPIINDIHCWRIHIRNPNKGLIVIGVCKQKMFKSDIEHKEKVYGIGCADNKWYPSSQLQQSNHINNENKNKNRNQIINVKHNKIDLTQFNEKECQIDMKLDSTKGELSFCMVHNGDDDENDNNNNNNKEAKIKGLPLDNYAGWVPYFNAFDNSVGCQLKIAVCPISWYGRFKDAIFE